MTLVRFDPFRGFEGIARRMNQFVNEFDKGFRVETGGFNPRVDIIEDNNNLYVHAELPGLKKEEVKISVNEDRVLTLKGERKKGTQENRSFIRDEIRFGSFSRSFILPENIDYEKIDAKFGSGVIELTIPKKEPEKPKEVEVDIK